MDNHPRNRELSSGPEDQFPIIHGTRIYIGNEVINTAFTRRPRLGSPPAVWKGREDGSDKFLATVQRFEFREAVFPPDTNGRRAQNRIETAKLAELAPLNEPVTVERIEEMAGKGASLTSYLAWNRRDSSFRIYFGGRRGGYRGDKVLTYIINMNYRVFAQIMDLSQKKDPKIVDQKIVSIHFEWTKPLSRQVA